MSYNLPNIDDVPFETFKTIDFHGRIEKFRMISYVYGREGNLLLRGNEKNIDEYITNEIEEGFFNHSYWDKNNKQVNSHWGIVSPCLSYRISYKNEIPVKHPELLIDQKNYDANRKSIKIKRQAHLIYLGFNYAKKNGLTGSYLLIGCFRRMPRFWPNAFNQEIIEKKVKELACSMSPSS